MNDFRRNIYTYKPGDNSSRTISINNDGHFMVGSQTNFTVLKEPHDYVALLTILETDRGQFEKELREKIEHDKMLTLVRELYKCGLSVSPYWTELVINWMDIKDINEELKPMLKDTTQDIRVNQKLRHRLSLLLTRNYQ